MRHRAIITSVVTVAASLLALAAAMMFTSTSAYAAGTQKQVWLTYYGWYDNTPPGCGISYPTDHSCAGGTGTYSDPITFATSTAEAPSGTIVYVPRVQKYFVMEDDCTECDQDWSGHGPDGGPKFWHFDLWIGGKGGNEFNAIDCEDALTQSNADGSPKPENVVINPPSNETVSSEPLFNTSTGACYGGARPSSTTGQYKNNSSGTCLTDPGNSSSSGTAMNSAACDGSASQQFTFNGAFMTINGLCVNNPSGSTLSLASCSGGPKQQWSVNPNGTIEDIQTSTKCFRVSGSSVIAGSCSGTAAQWTFSGTTSSPTPTASATPSSSSSPSVSPSPSPSSGGGGAGTIVGNHSGLCLSVTGNSTKLRATGDINTCDGSASEHWTVNSNGTIENANNLCLSVTGRSTSPKATTDVYTCNGSAPENWTVNADGTFTNDNSGLCLAVSGGSTSPGAIVDINTCNGSVSEFWSIHVAH